MNKYTLNYTLFGGTLAKPTHLKYEFQDDGDLLGALEVGATKALTQAQEVYGEGVDIILRSITHDNAQEWYQKLISHLTKEK